MSPCSLTSSSAGPLPCNVFRGKRGIVPATRPVFAHDRHRRRRRVSMPLFLKAHLAGSFSQAGCPYILCRPPPLPRFHRGISIPFWPPTPPAPSALLPRPLPGAWAVHGDIRGTAVSGSSPGSPRALDRGDIATGGGADGEGELVPPPLSLTLPRSHISSPPRPARAFGRGYPCTSQAPPPHPRLRQKIPVHFCRHPPPHPRLRRSSPAPFRGRGQCMAISGEQPYLALLQDLPVHWTVAISPRGVGPTGRGNSLPLPCL